MEDKQKGIAGVAIVILIIWLFSMNGTIKELKVENESLQSDNDDLQAEVSDYQDALQTANSNIEDAQGYAWLSYDEMGQALDNLETVSDPH